MLLLGADEGSAFLLITFVSVSMRRLRFGGFVLFGFLALFALAVIISADQDALVTFFRMLGVLLFSAVVLICQGDCWEYQRIGRAKSRHADQYAQHSVPPFSIPAVLLDCLCLLL